MTSPERRFNVVLVTKHPNIDPGEITRQLALKPCTAFRSGEAMILPNGNAAPGPAVESRWNHVFPAVAQDLVARKITSVKHLGMQGASNGGLLAGNMLPQYPQLFGAIVAQVPLLDMQRYSHLLAGASWMAEYGDPDVPQEWQFIRTFSPYHLFDAGKTYPPVLFTTSTRDDRVHPGHARKMAARMIDAGKDVTYYENIEGGHGGAASNTQSAYMDALAYTFLWHHLE